MKSEVTVAEVPTTMFPCLGRLKQNRPGNTKPDIEKVVLFTGRGEAYSYTGFVVHTNAPEYHPIGKFSDKWVVDAFDILPIGSSVTITV